MRKQPTRKKILKKNDLAHGKHVTFLEKLEDMSLDVFDLLMGLAVRDIVRKLKKDKSQALKKSDELKRGWSGELPRVDLDVAGTVTEMLDRYTKALRWLLLGDSAGRDAKIAAKLLRLDEFAVPGIVPSAYMNSLDTHRDHYEDLFGEEPPEINRNLIRESLEQIKDRTDRFMDEAEVKIKNRMIEAIEQAIAQSHQAAVAAVHETAHANMLDGDSKKKALDEAIKLEASGEISAPQISRALHEAIERYRPDWQLMTKVDTGMASSIAAHQSMSEVFGRADPDVRIVIIDFRDERECSFCWDAAHRSDGSFRVYSLSDFQPSGTNMSRKKKDWVLTWPRMHPNCRCEAVYLASGFEMDKNGNMRPKTL